MFSLKTAASFPALLVLAACASGSSEATWDGTVTDSAGVQIVQNTENSIWRGDAGWTLTEEFRIGSADGDPDYEFGQISGIVVGPNGNVFVLDAMASQVKVFGPEGLLLNRFGGPGSGPGELGQGAAMMMLAEGATIVIPDIANQRVNLYDLEGESTGSYAVQLETGVPVKWETTTSGTVVNQLRQFPFPGREGPMDTMDLIASRNSEGQVVDTILSIPAGQTFSMAGGNPQMKFFSSEPSWTLNGDDGVWFATNDEYRIELFDSAGLLSRVLTKPFERRPITEADQAAFLDAMMRLFSERGLPPQAVEQVRSMISFADMFPAFLQFFVGPNQSLWVQHVQAPSELTAEELETYNPQLQLGSTDWDVFNSEGHFLGVVEMPQTFQPMRFTDDAVYGIWRDELDVQYVMKLGIEAGDR
ncbi:MAG: 6-bladed beta-propeller [Gemmatimonadota bacterium]|nr:6-bladed beta-propeller [Gemmatimonadota bacterium]